MYNKIFQHFIKLTLLVVFAGLARLLADGVMVKDDFIITKDGVSALRYIGTKSDVIIPEGVKYVTDDTFLISTNFVTLSIPASVEDFDAELLLCQKLRSISVSPSNSRYVSKDGVLYSKDMKTLMKYPIGNSTPTFSVPNGVKEIGWGAFRNCQIIKSILLKK